ncbi:MAG TPA: flagellar filament capping protein FliD [Bryobacteraceae bacterium]|nr:flagellar filament capping protein FliD [Bryobacteraceae bacterium]
MSTSSIFAGNSRYASDFQAVIDRTVAIASLPISQLNKEKTALEERATALTALNVKLTAVETAVAGVESALGSGSYQASLDGDEVGTVTLGTGAAEGSYSLEVISLGAYSTSISNDEGLPVVTDPAAQSISTSAAFTMKVNGVAWSLHPAGNTLSSLAASINGSGAAVRATVVNVGSSSAPDYRLSLESTKLGAVSLELSDGSQQLLTTQVTGSKASYRVNGVAQAAESESRTIALAPGLTVKLTAESPAGKATSITVTRQSSVVASALSTLAATYNSAMDELDKHRGQADGALSGYQMVYSLGQNLRDMMNYYTGGSEGISSLSELGFSFEKNGRLTFSSMEFMAADMEGAGQVTAFLGSSSEGGFLKAAATALDSASNPVWGRMTTEMASVTEEINRTEDRIADSQERVDQLQVNLQERMAASDALIAGLEQSYSYISALLESMKAASESYG